MICDICAGELPADQHVAVNGINCHAVDCFGQALERLQFNAAELVIALDDSMKPGVAFKAGQTHVAATMVLGHRRAKSRAARSSGTRT